MFLHGLKSDMEGKKPLFLNRYCKKNKVNFLSLEYAGHGKSYGKFQDFTIRRFWDMVAKKASKMRKTKTNITFFQEVARSQKRLMVKS